MNKYILRTSLFWLVVFVAILCLATWQTRQRQRPTPAIDDIQPLAAGPSPQTGPHTTLPPVKMEVPLTPVQLGPEQLQSIGVKTGSAEYKQLGDDIRATGTVDIDERLLSYVQIRFPGYIRRVFANATYQYLRKGEPLFTIYSPELAATQQEYLLARQNQKAMSSSSVDGVATGAASLSSAAEQRLLQWDIPESEVTKLKETGKPIPDLTINSPVSGFITERNALPNMYVEPATRLYTVADLSRVWVNARVFQNDIGKLKPGDNAAITVDAYPDHTWPGRIEEILPQVDMTTRTIPVRIAINNPGIRLKPGMFVNVDLKWSLGRQLVVPASAVFQTGTRQLVFLNHGEGRLEPRDVVTGPRSGDDFVILKGLEAHQQIVTSANFLIDSESQLQAAASASIAPPNPSASTTSSQQTIAATIDFTSTPTPPRKGSNAFLAKLTDTNGKPITGANVSVSFYQPAMPAMGMASISTTAKLIDKGDGQYEGSCNIESGGTWQVTITALRNGQTIATKQLRLNIEGGM